MTNLKVNLNTISKRARDFLNNPQFINAEIDSDFELILDLSGIILTVYHKGNSSEVQLIFSEVLAVFAKNKTIHELWKVNFREVENFLRDENHLLAFPQPTLEFENLLNITKISMIAEGFKNLSGGKIYDLKKTVFDWENLNLVAKNQWAEEFLDIIGAELIFCDNFTLTFTNKGQDITRSDLEILVQKILVGEENVLPMKVVAV